MSVIKTIDRYITQSKRILFRSTKLPSRKEITTTSQITAIGILAMGLIGYLVHTIMNFIVQTFS